MGKGRPFGAKVFLEGIEVPMIGATISFAVDQASIAYIDLTPHQTINAIKPRTRVDLAVRDFQNPAEGSPYVLAWSGEVFGYSFSKTPSSRSFSIQAIDETSYWDNVLSYFFNAKQSLGKAADHISGVGMDETDAKKLGINWQAVSHSLSSFFYTSIKESLADPGKDFLDAVIDIYKKISGVNKFYSTAELRFRITEKILLHSSGELRTLIEEAQALDWFSGIVDQHSGYSTLRMVLQDLLSVIFHDYVTVPFPAAVEVPKGQLKGDPLKTSSDVQRTIGHFLFKPNLYMLPPPACNVFFPDEYSAFQYSRNFFKEPTRLIYKPELPRLAGQSMALPHVFEPAAFSNFMLPEEQKLTWDAFIGTSDTDVSGDEFKSPDFRFNKDNKTVGHLYDKLREHDFLTNEEKIRGIWIAQETMVPASSQFRLALSDEFRRATLQHVARYLFYKKRFQERGLQITSTLKMSVVPGFPVLLLDASDADQNIIAYCSSVTHRFYSTEGGFTQVQLSYARTVAEQDTSSGGASEPLVPPWFDKAIFGAVSDTGEVVSPAGQLTLFYSKLLGAKGCTAVTDLYDNADTLTKATAAILKDYRQHQGDSTSSVQAYITSVTSRDYIRIRTAFGFIGASTTTKDLTKESFSEFHGDKLEAKGLDNEAVVKKKRAIITLYRDTLHRNRGFRG
jgi:hypothetical protein